MEVEVLLVRLVLLAGLVVQGDVGDQDLLAPRGPRVSEDLQVLRVPRGHKDQLDRRDSEGNKV